MKKADRSTLSPLLRLRFSGPRLEVETLPIYELGSALVGVQRMIHKAYVDQAILAGRDPELPREVRERLALQIQDRKQGSDIYDFAAFLRFADASSTVSILIAQVLVAASAYVAKEVVRYLDPLRTARNSKERRRKKHADVDSSIAEPVDERGPLAVSIYHDIRLITDRIGGIGGVAEIELTSPNQKRAQRVLMTGDTRDYVRHIAGATVLGAHQELQGVVIKWDARNCTVDVRRAGDTQCKIFLSEKQFVDVRYKARPRDLVTFRGRPMYSMGSDMRRFNRFRAEQVFIAAKAR